MLDSYYKHFEVHMKFINWIKNVSKMGFVAVCLTKLSYHQNRYKFTLFYNQV